MLPSPLVLRYKDSIRNVCDSLSDTTENAAALRDDWAEATEIDPDWQRAQVLGSIVVHAWHVSKEDFDRRCQRARLPARTLAPDVERMICRDASPFAEKISRRPEKKTLGWARFPGAVNTLAHKRQKFPPVWPALERMRVHFARHLSVKDSARFADLIERRAWWAFDVILPSSRVELKWLTAVLVDSFRLLLLAHAFTAEGMEQLYKIDRTIDKTMPRMPGSDEGRVSLGDDGRNFVSACLSVTRNAEVALDVGLVILEDVIQRPYCYEPGTFLVPFLTRCMKREYVSRMRQQNRESSLDTAGDEDGAPLVDRLMGDDSPEDSLLCLSHLFAEFVINLQAGVLRPVPKGSSFEQRVVLIEEDGTETPTNLSGRDRDVLALLLGPVEDGTMTRGQAAASLGVSQPVINQTVQRIAREFSRLYGIPLDEVWGGQGA